MSNEVKQDFEMVPFSIVIDTNEGAPWGFRGIKGRMKKGVQLPLIVKTVKKPLWSWDRNEWGVGLADYSIDGLEYEVQIERKSVSDLFSTLGQRRENFENEISRLNQQCKVACIMIEGGMGNIASFREHGPEPSSVIGTMISWGQRYPKVHWIPAGSRDMAERLAFRFLERYWEDREDRIKSAAKLATKQIMTTTEGSTGNGSIEKTTASNSMGRTQPSNFGSNRH